jgi:putative tryptophan/tyrosine transport system substrate-binding protein
MRRRQFLRIVGSAAGAWPLGLGAAAWPLAGAAQQGGRTKRVAVLSALAADNPIIQTRLSVFKQELVNLGWSPGQNPEVDYRFGAGQSDRYPSLAEELVATRPDVILAHTTQVAIAVQRSTRDIPVVFFDVSDPIGTGFVASLARPAGNMTGVLLYEPGIVSKWLQMLREIATRVTRVALLGNPKTTAFSYFQQAAEAAARSVSIELIAAPVATVAEIEQTFQSLASMPNGGLIVLPDPTAVSHRELIISLAARYHLPAVYAFRLFITAGGLMAYETDQRDISRLAAFYIDRILRGAKPADLPVQVPTKYRTIVNLKTAKALNLEVPSSLLLQADDVIE